MIQLAKRLFREESGQGMVEYALLLALISVVSLVILGTIGSDVHDKFKAVADSL